MTPPMLRAVAFGASDGSLWGVAVEHGPSALVGAHGAATTLAWSEADDGGWRLEGDGVSLTVTPVAAPEPDPAAPAPPGERAVAGEGPERCRVRGTLAAADDCDFAGVRVALAAPSSERAALGSARLIAAWFPDGAAVAMLAARPRRVEHQDGDVATATVFDPEVWTAVSEPRLSTTYDAAGSPMRCSLELWIAHGDDEFPRRAAAEVRGAAGSVATDGLALQAAPLRSHSRGEDGVGVYAIATF